MSIKNIIIYLMSLGKSKAPATVSIEITSELFERCTRYNVTPERVINDFVANVCSHKYQLAGSMDNASISEYLSRAYGNMRIVNSQDVKQLRAEG